MRMHAVTVVVLLVVGLTGMHFVHAFPFGIFPILPTEWYYKPTPTESVILGLIVVKALAIRFASVIGLLPIPYHLNDLFVRSLGKRSVPEEFLTKNLTVPRANIKHLYSNRSAIFNKEREIIKEKELAEAIKVLSDLRRLDVLDCFLKSLCLTSHRVQFGRIASQEDIHIILTLKKLIIWTKTLNKRRNQSILKEYEDALKTGENSNNDACKVSYRTCPLSDRVLKLESMLTKFK